MKNLLFILILFILPLATFGQCGDTLVQIATSQSGAEAFFLKEYKIKFKRGDSNRPAPVARFSAFLKSDSRYRFNVANAKEYEGRAVLQLFNKGKMLGSTLDLQTSTDLKSFDFMCNETGTYQILMAYIEGDEGCSVGVLSVLPDTTYTELTNPVHNIMPETLYLGIDNPLMIGVDDEEETKLEVSVSSGKIAGKNGKYFFRPIAEGIVSVTAKTIDKSGFVTDEFVASFLVKKLPIPSVTIAGISGGLISKDRFLSSGMIEISTLENIPNSAYQVESFKFSDTIGGGSGKYAQGENFTQLQKRFIEKLIENSESATVYVKEIWVKSADGQRFSIDTMGFILQK